MVHHDHRHSSDHSHHHLPTNYNRAFTIGVTLNLIFVIVEAGVGWFAGSLALLADAGHNLSDVISLLLAWGAALLASRAATERRTYGFRKGTVLASLLSAMLLLVALGGITIEAIDRFSNPHPLSGQTVIIVATIGVLINTATALLFAKGQKSDLNIRGAFLHMAADAAVSFGVVVAGLLVMWKGWLWIDPAISLLIVLVVFLGTWTLLKESLNYATDAVPPQTDMPGIRAYLQQLDGVSDFHDLHVWPLSTTETALTVHLVLSHNQVSNSFLETVQQYLRDNFGIGHSTIQIESDLEENACMLIDGH